MTDAPSVTTFVVGDRLPWPDDPSGFGEKGSIRRRHRSSFGGSRRNARSGKSRRLGSTVEQRSDAGARRASRGRACDRSAARRTNRLDGRGELGVRFDDSIDMIALLNRKLVSQTPERRTMPRLEVRCPAHIKCGENFSPAMLRNISARRASDRRRRAASHRHLCVGVRRRAEHPGRRSGLEAGQLAGIHCSRS